jgi:hypothetical protein
MPTLRISALGFGVILLAASLGACGSDDENPSTGNTGTSGTGGTGGTSGAGGMAGSGGAEAGNGSGGSTVGGSAGAGGSVAGAAGTGGSDAGAAGAGGSDAGAAGAGGSAAGSAGTSGSAGAAGTGGTAGAAGSGAAGEGGSGGEAGQGQGGACLYPSTPSKSCTKTEDCAVVRGPSQCAPDYLGIQASGAKQFEAEAAYFRSCSPPPPCAANLPPTTDDGSVPLNEGDEAVVRCDAGQCRSSFLTDCTTRPAFSRACAAPSDCVAVEEPDCCSSRVRGIASGDAEIASKTFAAFVDSCRSCELVDCAGGARIADDDTTPPDGMPNAEPTLLCDAGVCKTTFSKK